MAYKLASISLAVGPGPRSNDKGDSPSSTTDLGEGELHTPHLTLVAETVLADELQLSVPGFPKSQFKITIDLSRVKLMLSGR